MLSLERGIQHPQSAQRFRCVLVRTISLIVLSLFVVSVQAADLEKPKGQPLLSITGNIAVTNSEVLIDGKAVPAASFDIDMLEAMPTEKFTTKNPWTEGATEFEGVRFNVLLESIGADVSNVSLYALDEYSVDIMGGKFNEVPIVVAYKRDGEYMSIRELGPLWLMYPFDDYPHLDTSLTRGHCVWQLIRIEVK